jgi:GTP-binding protein LepA
VDIWLFLLYDTTTKEGMNIRNFCIIAHIDHGKSTLADRLLEVTGTVELRKMKAQYLDQLELERERGITIKMAPVRMMYRYHAETLNSKSEFQSNFKVQNSKLEITDSEQEFVLNLIDTPGHPDFGYEVSRALEAVEGAILLVDATQGVQAQTLSNYYAAIAAGLKIIPAINKIDMPAARPDEVIAEVVQLTGARPEEVHRISGKTGEGVGGVLDDVIKSIPSPNPPTSDIRHLTSDFSRALIFDSLYDDHKGIIAVVRAVNGSFKAGDEIELVAVRERIKIKEAGYFLPAMTAASAISEGEIGYLVTGLKDPSKIRIGDTILRNKGKMTGNEARLHGYREPNPVVFVSFFPDEADDYDDLKKSLERLRLNDSAFSFEPDFNEVLGRGFKGGFLGKLHFEIVTQRLEREFGIQTVTSFPSVGYQVKLKQGDAEYVLIKNPKDLPAAYAEIKEPYIRIEIICPHGIFGSVLGLKEKFRWGDVATELLGDRMIVRTRMPLAELISDFDDTLKSLSAGYASFSYTDDGYERGELERMDILVAEEPVPGLSRIIPRVSVEYEARKMVKLLKDTLPRQQFAQAVQAKALGRIVARETIPAMKKDLGNFGKNGGDRTRKMKLWKKQKEGKKKLLSMAKVRISAEDFKKLLAK